MDSASAFQLIPPPPRGVDLPTEDGIPMETPLHRLIMTLLIEILELFWADKKDFYIGGNMFFYFSALQSKKNDFRGPDFFVVLDTERRSRDSWVLWEENGQVPNLILEITSPSTEAMDRGEKKRIYEKVLRIPEYFIYDPRTGVLEGYRLGPQRTYEPIPPTAEGRFPSQQLGLLLGVEEGIFLNCRDRWVRWYTPDGKLILSQQEQRAEAEQKRTEAEQKRTEAEQKRSVAEARAARLAEQLKEYEQRFGPLQGK